MRVWDASLGRALVTAAVALFLLTPGARAEVISYDSASGLSVQAAAGEANHPIIGGSPSTYDVLDRGQEGAAAPAVTAGPGCSATTDPQRVTCSITGPKVMTVNLCDGDDAFDVNCNAFV